MSDVYTCPKCGATLREHDESWDFSLGEHFALQLIGWPVFVVVLYAFYAHDVDGVIVAALVASTVSIFITWRVARARKADQPERFSCPKCLRVFAGRALRTKLLPSGDHAPS
jgi:predicted RNA-binding Zn-ribbon protein involved in translation (DUF1610 family)